jgi:hypothetical protein
MITWPGAPKTKEHAMSRPVATVIAVLGIDIGKNSFHIVGLDERGTIVLRQKWSRGQVETRSCPGSFREPGLNRGATG